MNHVLPFDVLEQPLRLAQQMLSQIPETVLDEKFDTLDDRKTQIRDGILRSHVNFLIE